MIAKRILEIIAEYIQCECNLRNGFLIYSKEKQTLITYENELNLIEYWLLTVVDDIGYEVLYKVLDEKELVILVDISFFPNRSSLVVTHFILTYK